MLANKDNRPLGDGTTDRIVPIEIRLTLLRRTLPISILTAIAAFAQDKPIPEATELSADGLKKLLNRKVELFFLDVREPKEIEELGTIDGYVNIPISQLQARLKEIPKDALLVTA